jgi:hypothetical protein
MLATAYGYVTDETVAILHDGSVVAYPKPLSIKQPNPEAPKFQVGPDELGLLTAPEELFVQSIVLLDRVAAADGPVAPVLQRVLLADALLALIPETSSQAKIEQPLQSLCRLIDHVGGVWKVTYSEAEQLPAALAPLFEMENCSGTTAPTWTAPALAGPSAAVQPARTLGECVRRTKPVDAVEIDGDLLVMLESEIVRLSGIAPAIWVATASARTVDELAEQVGNRHGRPEGYRAAVEDAVEQLIAKSILERVLPALPEARSNPSWQRSRTGQAIHV